jgi:Phage integrase family
VRPEPRLHLRRVGARTRPGLPLRAVRAVRGEDRLLILLGHIDTEHPPALRAAAVEVGDFDLTKGTCLVHGKGGKIAVMPIAFEDLEDDLHLELLTRQPDEYLVHPRGRPTRPLDPASLHRRSKVWLRRAGLPELRHSAADNLWRASGNLMLAQQLLRHESVATTQAYLHPTREDLSAALARLEVVRSADPGSRMDSDGALPNAR